jgi:hypothetical protein
VPTGIPPALFTELVGGPLEPSDEQAESDASTTQAPIRISLLLRPRRVRGKRLLIAPPVEESAPSKRLRLIAQR